MYRATHCARNDPLPLLPSGPGGVGGITSRRTRHTSHSSILSPPETHSLNHQNPRLALINFLIIPKKSSLQPAGDTLPFPDQFFCFNLGTLGGSFCHLPVTQSKSRIGR